MLLVLSPRRNLLHIIIRIRNSAFQKHVSFCFNRIKRFCRVQKTFGKTSSARVLAYEQLDMKKTNCGSTTREVFLFNHCRELSFLSQVYSVPFTLPWESGTSLISLDTFPRRRHFVIMDFFSRKTWKQVPKLGTLSVQEIDLHKFCPLFLSRVRLSQYLGRAGG